MHPIERNQKIDKQRAIKVAEWILKARKGQKIPKIFYEDVEHLAADYLGIVEE